MESQVNQILIEEIRENRQGIKEIRELIHKQDKTIRENKLKLTGIITFISIIINLTVIKIKTKLGV